MHNELVVGAMQRAFMLAPSVLAQCHTVVQGVAVQMADTTSSMTDGMTTGYRT